MTTDAPAGQGTLLDDVVPTTTTTTTTPAADTASTTPAADTASTSTTPPEDPRGERNRTWSVEVLLRSGRSERATVKAPSRRETHTYDTTTTPTTLVIEGVAELLLIAADEVAMIRVSKGA